MAKISKTIFSVLISVLILIIGTFFILRYLVVKSLPDYGEELKLSGLKSEVTVYFDKFAVPHIFAKNEDDLWFTQGYLHAQERLWQMDVIRRAGEGRLSEIFGSPTLKIDKQMRVLGIEKTSKEILKSLSPEELQILKFYADGVNEFIKEHKGKLPIEFDMLNYTPENWEPFQTLMISRLMAFELNISWYVDVTLGEIINRVGIEKASEIFPTYPENTPVTIPFATEVSSENYKNSILALNEFVNLDKERREFLGTGGMHIGSNSFAVAPAKSTTGFAILASDPHLTLATPAKWYEVHLVGGEVDVHGMSLPGVPFVIIGNNKSIAWGMTNVMLDDADFYIEEVDKTNEKNYLSNSKSIPFKVTDDSIFVKDSGFVQFSFRSTYHGPIINDVNKILVKEVSAPIAMRWSAAEVSVEIKAFNNLIRATDWRSFREAIKYFGAPAQNFVYADAKGNIGFQLGGKIPIRSKNNPTIPMNGNSTENDWKGYVPYEELPSMFNPKQNYVASANNKTTGKNFPYHITNLWEPPSRIQKIDEMLSSTEKISPDFMKKIQNDYYSFFAKDLTAHLLKEYQNSSSDEQLQSALNYLKNWNFEIYANDVAPTIFAEFFQMIIKNTLHDEIGDNLLVGYQHLSNIPYRVMLTLLEKENSLWFDNVKTEVVETKSDIIKQSFVETISNLNNKLGSDIKLWRWGKLHSITFEHPIGSQAPFGILFNIGPFEIGGDGTTVNNAEYSLNNPYKMTVGPSMRRVIDFGNLDEMQTIIPTGQSGQALSDYYKDQVSLWINGEYKTTSMNREKIEKDSKFKNVYKPKEK